MNSSVQAPLLELPRLLSAAERVASDDDSDDDLRLLLAPGSSLGGARPKASVRDHDGHLAIAKFPRREDDYDVVAWEAVALDLAQHSTSSCPMSASRVSPDGPCLLLGDSIARAHRASPTALR